MPPLVVTGAMCSCVFGVAPSALTVLPVNMVTAGTLPAASVMDTVPMTNIMPFGMCTTPTNPQVAAATAAALGVLTPQPCIPVIPGPWTPGALKVQIRGAPALHQGCTAMCAWGGMITISNPGQFVVQVI
ncbi:MAG TPA: DUF4280 domain-containing protein [Dehalococcoidia bacterium]|nr:DUF4280 domain-containing protein [Dehalococcoidia bacterium]